MENIIDKIEEKGNFIIDTILKPLVKGGKGIIIDDSKIIKSFLSLKTAFMENKLLSFLEFIEDNQNDEILDFIESMNKVIDLDDKLQIYIMAYLTKQYQLNNKLNYYEKQLFYNINILLEDDFKIYFCMYKDNVTKNKKFIYVSQSYINKEILEISLNKFSNIGLLKIKTNIKNQQGDTFESSIYYYTSEYSKNLFKCLSQYFNNSSCADLIKKEKNLVKDGNLKFY